MAVRIVPVDPLDPTHADLFTAWHELTDQVGAEQYGEWRTIYSPREIRARHELETTVRLHEFAAVVDGAVVGTLEVELPQADNRRRAELYVTVRQDRRRRGIGTRLLATGEQLAADNGRTVFGSYSELELGGADGATRAFAHRHGYQVELTELRSDLLLPVPADRLAALDAEMHQHAAGYEVLTQLGEAPGDWLTGRAELSRHMSRDVPQGGLDYEEEAWDAVRVRRGFELARAQGRQTIESVARHAATGDLVGYTTLHVPEHTPRLALQWDTLVRHDHRGHRLGLALKVANLRALAKHRPDVARISTYNAAENKPMLRVNRALGFQTVGYDIEWQKRRT